MTVFKGFSYRYEVPKGFRHLLAVDGQQAVVAPAAGEGFAGRLRLGDLVFMMGKHQIDPASVEVKGVTEILRAHRRAFDVPAGPPLAPRALPRGLAWFGRLPQGEIQRVLFPLPRLDPRARL